LKAYDYKHFGASRDVVLENMVVNQLAYVAIEKGNIVGFCVSTKTIAGGSHIGPLFADTPNIAETLLITMCQAIVDKGDQLNGQVSVGIPNDNIASVELAKKYHFEPQYECVRMYNVIKGQNKPLLPLNNIFALTCFEYS